MRPSPLGRGCPATALSPAGAGRVRGSFPPQALLPFPAKTSHPVIRSPGACATHFAAQPNQSSKRGLVHVARPDAQGKGSPLVSPVKPDCGVLLLCAATDERGAAEENDSVAKALRDLHRVHRRKTKIISDGPNPEAGRVVRISRHAIHQDFVRTGSLDRGRRILRATPKFDSPSVQSLTSPFRRC